MDDTVDYCRQIETYLCRKNGGHLVRIVGPAFEKVRGWAAQGVPLKVAFRGIDRCCERANARGGRRRPMRIEFCEPDVLEGFEDWRRAIGLSATHLAEAGASPADADREGESRGTAKRSPLAAHIQRSVTRLLAPKALTAAAGYDARIHLLVGELDELAVQAKEARGDARAKIVERLGVLDSELLDLARTRVDPSTAAALQSEADAELAGFAGRMPAEALARARRLAFERGLRDALNLPVLSYE